MNSFQLKEKYPKTDDLRQYLGWTDVEEIDLIAVCINLCQHIQELENKIKKQRPGQHLCKHYPNCGSTDSLIVSCSDCDKYEPTL